MSLVAVNDNMLGARVIMTPNHTTDIPLIPPGRHFRKWQLHRSKPTPFMYSECSSKKGITPNMTSDFACPHKKFFDVNENIGKETYWEKFDPYSNRF
jgi:hypothetical protein